MNTPEPLDVKWIDEILERNDPNEMQWAQNVLTQWMDELPDEEYEIFMDGVGKGIISEHHMSLFLDFANYKKDERSLWDKISEEL